MSDTGNAAQTRVIAEQVAEAAITRFHAEHPELRHVPIPSPLKWAAAIVAAVMTAGVSAMALWLVSTVNSMQVTLARMDERMANQDKSLGTQFDDLNRRVTALESVRK